MTETWTGLRPTAVPRDLDLRILSYARWPEAENDPLPQIAGFILSSFNPLVAEVARRCLDRRTGSIPANVPGEAPGTRTALLLASVGGDRATAQAIADAVRTGRRVAPLLFFQSNPNAVLGHIAARRRLTGPVVSISPPPSDADGIPADAFTEADWLLRDGDADEVLLIAAEQCAGPGEADRAEAVLVERRP